MEDSQLASSGADRNSGRVLGLLHTLSHATLVAAHTDSGYDSAIKSWIPMYRIVVRNGRGLGHQGQEFRYVP